MKRVLNLSLAFIALLSATAVFAQNPHPQSPFRVSKVGNELKVCYDIAGLGNASSVPATLTYDALVQTFCYNKGSDSGPVPGQSKTLKNQSQTFDITVTNGRATDCYTTTNGYACGTCKPSFDASKTTCTASYSNIKFTAQGKTFSLSDPQ